MKVEIRPFVTDYAVVESDTNGFEMGITLRSRRNAETIKRIIEVDGSVPNAATVCDMVEVVRCKDCKHLYCCSAVDRWFYCRHLHGLKGVINPIEENPYCSYGERKDIL